MTASANKHVLKKDNWAAIKAYVDTLDSGEYDIWQEPTTDSAGTTVYNQIKVQTGTSLGTTGYFVTVTTVTQNDFSNAQSGGAIATGEGWDAANIQTAYNSAKNNLTTSPTV